MERLLGFGRRLWFVCRVFTGIEERSLRAQNVELQKKLMQMRERKAMLQRVPEQLILSEVQKVVEGMQRLNDTLNKTEKNIGNYFQSIRKDAYIIMEVQLEAEQDRMHEMKKLEEACKIMLKETNAMNKEDYMQEMTQAMSAADMTQETNATNKEDIMQEMAQVMSVSVPQENIALKKEEKDYSDKTNSISHNVEATLESKEKNPQGLGR